MTDIQKTTEGLRAQFTSNAKLPSHQIADAEKFISSLKQNGKAPDAKTLENGKALLKSLENSTELFAFNATVLAAQESSGDHDLDARLKTISSGVEQAERTTTKLRQTLEAYGR